MKYATVLLVLLIAHTALVYPQATIQVTAGWNNIGSLCDGAIGDVLTTNPPGIIASSFFGYTPGAGYFTASTLGIGRGYWIKVSQDGSITFTCPPCPDPCGTLTVDYEGKTYNTVLIGSQCWLKENLDIGTMVTGVTDQTDNATIEKYCYNDDPANCDIYGGLYQWDEAMQYSTSPGAQGICPTGWHISTLAEFQTLSSAVGGDGNALKAIGQGSGGGEGTNTSGFSALLAGYRHSSDGSFASLGTL